MRFKKCENCWPLFGAAIIVAALLSGCSLNNPYPDRALFTITPTSPQGQSESLGTQAPIKSPLEVTLRVRRIIAVPPYGGTAFVYRNGTHQLQTDYYDAFAAPPADLLTSELLKWLRATRQFAAVVDGNAGLTHQWVLEGRLQELEVDVTKGQAPEAVLTLEFVLLDDSAVTPRTLMEHTYSERVKISGKDASSAAEGWSAACERVFMRLIADISRDPAK